MMSRLKIHGAGMRTALVSLLALALYLCFFSLGCEELAGEDGKDGVQGLAGDTGLPGLDGQAAVDLVTSCIHDHHFISCPKFREVLCLVTYPDICVYCPCIYSKWPGSHIWTVF